MFGLGKKKQQTTREAEVAPKKTKIDKLVMGAIIGVAVGSVVGMAIAPQKGSETRKMIADKGMEAINKSREFKTRVMDGGSEVKKGLFGRLIGWLFERKKGEINNLKKIPTEQPARKQ